MYNPFRRKPKLEEILYETHKAICWDDLLKERTRWENIKVFFSFTIWDQLDTIIRKAIKFPKTLIAFIPIIWNDRDFDYAYLNYIIVFKLRRMANGIEKYGMCEKSDEVVKDLRYHADWLENAEELVWDDLRAGNINSTVFQEVYTSIGYSIEGWWD